MKIRFVVSIALPVTLLLLLPVMSEAKGKGKQSYSPAQPSTDPRPTTRPSPVRKTAPDKPAEEPVFEDDTPDELSGSDSEPSAKNAVPSDDAQQAATKLVKEVYCEEYENAKTPEQKKALARTLLQKAIETEKDLPGKYVLLRLSRDIASQAADGTTAFRAIAEMATTFTIDDAVMKVATLKKLSSAVHTVKQHEAIAKKAMELADKAVSKETFPLAKQLNEIAVQEGRNARVPQLIAQATEQTSQLEKNVASFDAAQAAAKVLEKKPDDPEANLAAGKYKCFIKADWEHGLPMLALGSDAELRAVAAKELAGAESTDAQVTMGDAWWDLAEKADSSLKEKLQGRAAYWYSKALPELSGLSKAKVERRISGRTELDHARKEEWISKDATYVASSVYRDDHPALPSLLNESDRFYMNEYAFETKKQDRGAHIVIDLGKPMSITRIYIQNRTKRSLYQRANGLTIWCSATSNGRGRVVWTAPSATSEWNVEFKKTTTARFITIGLPDQIANQFHLKKVKIFGYP